MGYNCMTCSDASQRSLLLPFDIKSPRPWGYILLELPEFAVGGPPLFVSLSINLRFHNCKIIFIKYGNQFRRAFRSFFFFKSYIAFQTSVTDFYCQFADTNAILYADANIR